MRSSSSDLVRVSNSFEIALEMATSSEYAMAASGNGAAVRNSVKDLSRLARNRRRHKRHLQRSAAANSRLPRRRLPLLPPTPTPPLAREVNGLMLRFLFQKQLQKSDVNAAGRIVIPKRVAELHLPPLDSKEGIWMHFDDLDYLAVWTFKFRFWPNNSSRMYIFDSTKSFCSLLNLKIGDSIMVFIDDLTGSYFIRARKNFESFFFREEMVRPSIAYNGRISLPPDIQRPENSFIYYEDDGSSSMVGFGGLDVELHFTHFTRPTTFESIDFIDFFE